MAEIDYRIEKKPVARHVSGAITHIATGTADIEVTMKNVNMTVKTVVYRAGNTTNDITRQLVIKDDNESIHFDKSSIGDNAKTVLNSQKTTQDFPPFSVNGDLTLTVTPSAAAGNTPSDYVDLYGV